MISPNEQWLEISVGKNQYMYLIDPELLAFAEKFKWSFSSEETKKKKWSR